jgi:hypothetical protein
MKAGMRSMQEHRVIYTCVWSMMFCSKLCGEDNIRFVDEAENHVYDEILDEQDLPEK